MRLPAFIFSSPNLDTFRQSTMAAIPSPNNLPCSRIAPSLFPSFAQLSKVSNLIFLTTLEFLLNCFWLPLVPKSMILYYLNHLFYVYGKLIFSKRINKLISSHPMPLESLLVQDDLFYFFAFVWFFIGIL